MEQRRLLSKILDCLNIFRKVNPMVENERHSRGQHGIKGEIISQQHKGKLLPEKNISIQLCSSSEIDPKTIKGRLSGKANLKVKKSTECEWMRNTTYAMEFHVQPSFGIPGAFIIKNLHDTKFFLQSVALELADNQIVHFECNSWIYPTRLTKKERIFFANTCYLPDQTPNGLVGLRKDELISLRGDGTGERQEWDRIYDYDYYNDLGNPDRDLQYARPVVGGSHLYPYPRRGRTGRSPCSTETQTESQSRIISLDTYVPLDERFSLKKLSEFTSNSIQAAMHFVIPEIINEEDSIHFESFLQIRNLFTRKRSVAIEDKFIEVVKDLLSDELFKKIKQIIKENPSKYSLPQIIAENEFAWKDDQEFGRQMIAGINPTVIQCLQMFPPTSKTGAMSSITTSHIEHDLDGLTLFEAMNQWRIFILDHHDYLIPHLNRINTKGTCAYASRTLLFLRDDATLKPLAIELSLPSSYNGREINRVFLPATEGTEAALWQLAKAHVAANDFCYHQLNSHWLKTHAVVEPFIIATRRQLSKMHPVHRLLEPHFKDTMHINALARTMLINAGGLLENTLLTGDVSMQLSSELYKEWRFDEQGLPADLVKRGMALVNPEKPAGVQLLFDDYPYGVDGLDIWIVIKSWVTDFCSFFYTTENSVMHDHEIQAWWSEIKNVGHGDKRNETWWHSMTTLSDLIETLTTLIWITSAFHASVNFGQYEYAGYPPNCPTRCRNFIPEEGTFEFAEFLGDPDKFYLKMLPTKLESSLSIALVEVLSRHYSDEEFMGQWPSPLWTDSEQIHRRFKKFSEDLQEVEKIVRERNKDPKMKNRCGTAKIPYKLLCPNTSRAGGEGSIIESGIPNSISI